MNPIFKFLMLFVITFSMGTLFSACGSDEPDSPNTTPDAENPLAGTNWSGKIDGDYVELSFRSNGTFTENWAGDKSVSTYTILDDRTIVIGDYTVMSNTFGWNPFNFQLNSNKTSLTFWNQYERWTFSRKQ